MQVNKTNDTIGNFEFYLDSEYIIKDKILDSICSRNFETNVKCNDQKLLIIFKNDDILLELKLTNDELRYRISIIHSKPKIDETFIYCKYDEVQEKSDFKKYKYQLREDLEKLIKNIVFYKHKEDKNNFIKYNEFKYSKEFEIPDKRKDFVHSIMDELV